MKRGFLLVLALIFVVTSCNMDNNVTQQEQATEDPGFFALRVGNTWTYEYYSHLGQGQPFSFNVFDTVEITGTSEMNENTYFIMETTTEGNGGSCGLCPDDGTTVLFVRDSIGYLVTNFGEILFSSESTEDYLQSENDWGDVYRVLLEEPENVIVEAGAFECLNNQRYAILPDGTMSNGTDDLFFSEGVGEIKRTYAGVSTGRLFYDRRLKSFEISTEN